MKRSRQKQTCFLPLSTAQRIRPEQGILKYPRANPPWLPPANVVDGVATSNTLPSSQLRATATLSPLWGKVSKLSTYPEARLGLAFVLGGIFFAKLLPRFLAVLALCWQHLTRHRKTSIKQKPPNSFRRKSSVNFRTVGRKGLVVVQHVANKLAGRSLQTQLKRALQEGISQVSNPNIRSIEIVSFKTNPTPRKTPPVFKRGRIYDSEDSMVFDADIDWRNCLDAELKITTRRLGLEIPVRVHNCRLRADMRFILTPLLMQPPGFGACLVSFPRMPDIDADITVAGGQITKVKWLKQELMDALGDIIEQEMLWPNRAVNPMLQENWNATKITKEQIEKLETSDPFLELEKESINSQERKSGKFRRKRRKKQEKTPEGASGWDFLSSWTAKGNEWIQGLTSMFQSEEQSGDRSESEESKVAEKSSEEGQAEKELSEEAEAEEELSEEAETEEKSSEEGQAEEELSDEAQAEEELSEEAQAEEELSEEAQADDELSGEGQTEDELPEEAQADGKSSEEADDEKDLVVEEAQEDDVRDKVTNGENRTMTDQESSEDEKGSVWDDFLHHVVQPFEDKGEEDTVTNGENRTMTDQDSSEDGDSTSLWDELLNRVVQPLELCETDPDSTASNSTNNSTKHDNLPDLKRATQKMSEVGSLKEFLALFDEHILP